ncbi:hypothetical protein BS17DRAFT_790974 [Gyrodon lividus]|nr:hypothetical protein BS17DRAFT_790974 [Gyrodon lividus]
MESFELENLAIFHSLPFALLTWGFVCHHPHPSFHDGCTNLIYNFHPTQPPLLRTVRLPDGLSIA